MLDQITRIIIRFITLLLKILVSPLGKLSNIIFPPGEFDDARKSGDRAARVFCSEVITPTLLEGGSNPFEASSYATAVASAHRNHKLLMVYLHSPQNPDARHFVRNCLGDGRVLNFLNSPESNVMCWGGSINAADGASVAQGLKVCAYPFVALLSCQRGSRTAEILFRMEGLGSRANDATTARRTAYAVNEIPFHPTDFLAVLSAHVLHYQTIIEEAAARRRVREEEVALRAEQDREFQETLAADRRREAERLEEERLERERVQKEEENARLEEAQRQSLLDEARQLVPEEPPAGSPGVARLRLFLPSGSRVDRRFHAQDHIAVIRAYVQIYFHEKEIAILNFELSSNYPKKILDDNDASIEEALGALQAVIMVRDLDA